MIAICQTTERLGKIQRAKSYVDGSSLHNSPIYHQRLIDKHRTRRHEQGIFVHAGNDVHLSGHSDHHEGKRKETLGQVGDDHERGNA